MPIRGPVRTSFLARARVNLEWRTVEREPVVLAGDPERLTEAARPRAQEPGVVEPAPRAHRVETLGRLEGANQDRARHSLRLADEVEAPVDAVGAVDVRVAGRAEHRSVAGGPTPVAVRRRVLVVVGLDLDDRPAHAVDEERRSHELGRHLVHRAFEEASLQLHSRAFFES